MKIFLSILLFCLNITFAQENVIAIITEPQIGAESNSDNLIKAVNDINKRAEVTFVVVLGNITANGKFDEFIWAQEILDGLNIPYTVVGGEKDYFLSESKGSEISLIWSNDKNIFENKDYSLICINSILPKFPAKKYIEVETVNSISENISSSHTDKLITFSYYPINLAENIITFYNEVLDKKIFSFVSKEIKNENSNSTYEGLYLNRKDAWGYLLVSTKKDSVVIKKILSDEIIDKVKPEIIKSNFAKPFVLESRNSTSFRQKESLIWSVSFDKTINESSVYEADNIFNFLKDGSVICLSSEGSEKWYYATHKRLIDSPVNANDIVTVASEDGDIFTLNANTGDPNQIISIGEKITSGVSVIEFDEAGNKTKAVVVGTQYGNIYCYDLYTLDPIWTQQLSETNSDLKIVSKIAYSNNKIFFFDNQNTLYCLSAMNGLLIWKIQVSKNRLTSNSDIIVKNNSLFLIDGSGNLFCVDALLGKQKWNLKNIYANGSIIASDQNELFLTTTKNKIAIVSTKLGRITREIELRANLKNGSITDLLILGDNILVSFSDGWVYKINSKKKVEKLFLNGVAPIVSLTDVNGNCLITDYDGKLTLLKISSNNK